MIMNNDDNDFKNGCAVLFFIISYALVFFGGVFLGSAIHEKPEKQACEYAKKAECENVCNLTKEGELNG